MGPHEWRWISLSEGGRVGFAEAEPYAFLEGTVFIKHFELPFDEPQAELRKPTETRFLVSTSTGFYGVTCKWDDAGNDATPVPEGQRARHARCDACRRQRTAPTAFLTRTERLPRVSQRERGIRARREKRHS